MNSSDEYTIDSIIKCLKDYFEHDNYDVVPYSDLFLPARVPLYCFKDILFFNLNEVPGSDNEKFLYFLKERIGIDGFDNPEINKLAIDKNINEIIVSENDRSAAIILKKRYDKIELNISDEKRKYNFFIIEDNGQQYLSIRDEKVIEITTERYISKDKFFRDLHIEKTTELVKSPKIEDASQLSFYQFYFPSAEIYLAYPGNSNDENKAFGEFKDFCKKKGIGLINIVRHTPEIILRSSSLLNKMCEDIDIDKNDLNIENIVQYYQEEYTKYLVLYPEPIYKRRIITAKMPDMISLIVIDKLQELTNLQDEYQILLKNLAKEFRLESDSDYDIALKIIKKLWEKRLGLEYPEIHRQMEEILQRNEFYREHFVHQFQVFLIGAYILDRLYENITLKKVLLDFNKNGDKIEDVWLAASTYHDFNYGIQNFDIWLLQYLSDTLFLKDEEAKQSISILNLDAVMVREYLTDKIIELINIFKLDENKEKKIKKFLYEKAVIDKNHGILSALSLLKLRDSQKDKVKIKQDALLQAALAIACHDEDIWEALSRCKGYLRSPNECDPETCSRGKKNNERKCETWEKDLMEEEIIKHIDFEKWPIIFLLILCDSIQDEGRVTSELLNNKSPFLEEKKEKIDLNDTIINDWIEANKKLEKYRNGEEIKNAFLKKGYKISKDSRIYEHRLYDNKWKIVDENMLYIIERDNGEYLINLRRKECTIGDIIINNENNEIKINLKIDGHVEKHKELVRLSWVLKDEHFRINIEEKSTTISKDIVINGHGGGE